jgi:16S rRNA (cytidine1402-2'-O)-methyltransferase
MTGSLVVVATPIGNLGDITQRAVQALTSADIVACEDSRHSGKLLKHLGISDTKYLVVNEHTERDACAAILDAVSAGKTVALITDAGTPGISDPGSVVVRAVVDAGLPVTAAPGPAAFVMALVLSGLSTTRFVFEGFLPRSGTDRTERLAEIVSEPRTVVFYEAPHRIARTLADLAAVCPADRRIAVARELTKMHEEIWRGTVGGAVEHFDTNEPMGEFVVVLEGAPPRAAASSDDIDDAIDQALAAGLSVRDAADAVASALGVPKRTAYQATLARKKGAQ